MTEEKFDSDKRFAKPFIELTDQIKKDGSVPLEMTDFDYLPTLRCDLKCKHCRQSEVRDDKEWEELTGEMNMDQIRSAWDPIPVEGKIVKINGGEPFVKKDMWNIFDYFIQRGAYMVVATNAWKFRHQENIDRLRGVGLVEITTSFDGLGEHHDAVRGRAGLFDVMTNFVRDMSRDHKVLLECCIQGDNVRDLPEMVRLREQLGAYKIRFQLPVFTTEKEIASAAEVVGGPIKYEAQTMSSPRYDFEFNDLWKSYQAAIDTGLPFDMHPKFFEAMPIQSFERRSRKDYNLLCTYMFRNKIDPNGDVRFCPFIIQSFGNIQEEKFEDIWNKQEFRDYRKAVANNNLLDSCENCPHTRIYSIK